MKFDSVKFIVVFSDMWLCILNNWALNKVHTCAWLPTARISTVCAHVLQHISHSWGFRTDR